MNHARSILIIVAGLLLLAAEPLEAQSRKRRTIGNFSVVGKGTAGRSFENFRQYSAGVGTLTRGSGSSLGRGALDSTLRRTNGGGLSRGLQQQNYNPAVSPTQRLGTSVRSRRVASPSMTGAGSMSGARASRSVRLRPQYAPSLPSYGRAATRVTPSARNATLNNLYTRTDPREIMLQQLSASNSSASHLAALASLENDAHSAETENASDQPSLAPAQPGMVRRMILKGEAAFRNGDFAKAADAFTSAASLSFRSPETLVSLARARFAIGQEQLAGMNLSEALVMFPELPQLDLAPSDFYANAEAYADHLAKLQEIADTSPWEPNTSLLLAYHAFRAGHDDRIREPLARALAVFQRDKDEDSEDAVGILWDSLVAQGIVEGELEPAVLPEKLQPESPESSPDDNADNNPTAP